MLKICYFNDSIPHLAKQHPLDVGYDLYAYQVADTTGNIMEFSLNNSWELYIQPGYRYKILHGISLWLPPNTCAMILSRSGLSLKQGIRVHNSPGLIDPSYSGEIATIIINDDHSTHVVKKWDRVSQMLLNPIGLLDHGAQRFTMPLEEFNLMRPKTGRNESGFGSTGKK